jgi:regulatory protein YycH of two-component signal transduction system YycFG
MILTFSIWSYTPPYQVIEESQVEQITVGEQKELHQVLKPYRLLVNENGNLSGTITDSVMDDLISTFSNLNASELRFVQSNLTEEKINSMIRTNHRMTLFFSTELPINTFRYILEFTQDELPEVTFNSLIIDWSKFNQTRALQLLFVSEENRTLYSTEVSLSDEHFNATFKDAILQSVPYEEIKRDNRLSLYVPVDPMELVQFTYYIDEISPDTFKELLFNDPNIVQKNIESVDSSKYTDGMAFMTSDTNTKTINYVYPASESIGDIKESILLQDSFDFINDHGGLTGDFRYVYMNARNHITEYQLFLEGVPVFSSATSTRITTTWGDKQIFRYKRPYYLLEMDITSEKAIRTLPSGAELVQSIQNMNDIDDIVIGYYLKKSENELLYTLEPSWFVIDDGSWTRLTTESLGGAEYGLE